MFRVRRNTHPPRLTGREIRGYSPYPLARWPVREEASMAMDAVPHPRTVRLRSAVFVFASLIVVNMIAALVVLRTLGIAG